MTLDELREFRDELLDKSDQYALAYDFSNILGNNFKYQEKEEILKRVCTESLVSNCEGILSNAVIKLAECNIPISKLVFRSSIGFVVSKTRVIKLKVDDIKNPQMFCDLDVDDQIEKVRSCLLNNIVFLSLFIDLNYSQCDGVPLNDVLRELKVDTDLFNFGFTEGFVDYREFVSMMSNLGYNVRDGEARDAQESFDGLVSASVLNGNREYISVEADFVKEKEFK